MNQAELESLIPPVIKLIKKAGETILTIYQSRHWDVQHKEDKTPVTQADLQANEVLCDGLRNICPDIPIISEEIPVPPFAEREAWPCHWLLDPLDGTKEFLAKTGEFAISLALISEHRPLLGFIYGPVDSLLYYAGRNIGAFVSQGDADVQALSPAVRNQENLRIVTSRRQATPKSNILYANLKAFEVLHCGSALKFAMIASNQADIYPRFGKTSEWDTAAGQILVETMGGKVVDASGERLRYNMRESMLNPEFIAFGDTQLANLLNTDTNTNTETDEE